MKFSNQQFRKKMIQYLDEHWKEDLTPAKTADTFGYTERYFLKKFKECFLCPFGQFVTKVKLRRVAGMMIERNSMANLGLIAGFSNPQSFSKGFKKEFGISPKQFLRSMEEIHDLSFYYEVNGKQVFFAIPMPKRNWNQGKSTEGEGPEAWTKYIDEHIRESFTIRELAEHFNYSERHFRDTFLMYYSIPPVQYIKKRKLYLIAKELRSSKSGVQDVIRKYGFHSVSAFRKDFYKEFHIMPEEYEEEYKILDMSEYYSINKQTLKVTYEEMDTIETIGKDVVPPIDKKHVLQNLMQYITNALEQTDEKLEEFCADEMILKDKFIVWQTEPETEEIVCLTCIKKSEAMKMIHPLWSVKLSGGVFAVLETQNVSDKEKLEYNYQLLYRCAYAGWIKENRARIDFDRLSFVRYVNEKLYFYIPVNE